jgi:hypothetical protein
MKPIRWPRPGEAQESRYERLRIWMAHNRDQWVPVVVVASLLLLVYVLAMKA